MWMSSCNGHTLGDKISTCWSASANREQADSKVTFHDWSHSSYITFTGKCLYIDEQLRYDDRHSIEMQLKVPFVRLKGCTLCKLCLYCALYVSILSFYHFIILSLFCDTFSTIIYKLVAFLDSTIDTFGISLRAERLLLISSLLSFIPHNIYYVRSLWDSSEENNTHFILTLGVPN